MCKVGGCCRAHARTQSPRRFQRGFLCRFAHSRVKRGHFRQFAGNLPACVISGIVLLCLPELRLDCFILRLHCVPGLWACLADALYSQITHCPAHALQKPRCQCRAFQLALQIHLHLRRLLVCSHIRAALYHLPRHIHALFRRPLHCGIVHILVIQDILVFFENLIIAQKAVVRLVKPRLFISGCTFRHIRPWQNCRVDGCLNLYRRVVQIDFDRWRSPCRLLRRSGEPPYSGQLRHSRKKICGGEFYLRRLSLFTCIVIPCFLGNTGSACRPYCYLFRVAMAMLFHQLFIRKHLLTSFYPLLNPCSHFCAAGSNLFIIVHKVVVVCRSNRAAAQQFNCSVFKSRSIA